MTQSSSAAGPVENITLFRAMDLIAIGTVFYGILASGLLQGPDAFPLGQNIYDEYYLAILSGHLDLPARVVQIEGHYTADGTAYLYHGVGPLLTRFLLGWFWPFQSVGLAQLSVWAWACLGTLCYHAAFLKVCAKDLGQLGSRGLSLSRLLGIAIWFSSPGFLLAANTSFYHEPIALAYAATGAFVLIWTHVGFGNWPFWRAAIPCALLAALTLHARPNIAIGLYLACTMCLLVLTATALRQHWLRIALAFAILGASGVGYLGLNVARFGDATQTHGSFAKAEVQYGFVYWGFEETDSDRAEAFKKHGKFNIRRIPHNFTLYAFDPPMVQTYLDPVSEQFHAFTKRVLAGDLGFIKVEQPYAGIVFLWPLWLVFAFFAPSATRTTWRKMAIPLAGGLTIALLTLSYGSVAFRYRIDLWPALSLLALIGLAALVPKFAAAPEKAGWKWGLGACFMVGLLMSANSAGQLRFFQVNEQTKPVWTMDQCRLLTENKGFSEADTLRICQPPRIGG